jgi:hypothetical protein
MKKCSKCNKKKLEKEFNKKARRKLQSFCRDCQHKSFKKYYENNKKYHCSKVKIRKKFQLKINRKFIRDYLKSHPCVDCNEKDIVVLVFDHVKNKKIEISKMVGKGYSIESIKKEIEKCEVRCANCHTRKHYVKFYE